jgi:hypothetical protein
MNGAYTGKKTHQLCLCINCGGVEISKWRYENAPIEHLTVRLTISNATNKILLSEPSRTWHSYVAYCNRHPNWQNRLRKLDDDCTSAEYIHLNGKGNSLESRHRKGDKQKTSSTHSGKRKSL